MEPYAARLEVDYPEELDRVVSTFFRIVWAIPILILSALISGTGSETITTVSDTGETLSQVTRSGGGITGGIFVATALMLVIRRKYPRWWFDFLLEFERFLGPGWCIYGSTYRPSTRRPPTSRRFILMSTIPKTPSS